MAVWLPFCWPEFLIGFFSTAVSFEIRRNSWSYVTKMQVRMQFPRIASDRHFANKPLIL
jgi:hypothetical protein